MKGYSALRVMVVSVLLLAGIVLATYWETQLRPAPEDTPLVEIKHINDLRAQFNQDAGKTRIILLLSPT